MIAGSESAANFFPNSEGIDVKDGKLYFSVKKKKVLYVLDLDKKTYESSSTVHGSFDGMVS